MTHNQSHDITTLSPSTQSHEGHNRVGMLVVGVLAVGAVVYGIDRATQSAEALPQNDTCTDGGHALVSITKGETWEQLASTQQEIRKYDINPASLAQVNPSIAQTGADGVLSTEINFEGLACATLPGPDVPGIIHVDGEKTDGWYAHDNYMKLADLRKLNPGVTKNKAQVLPEGDILKIKEDPDMSLVMREMVEKNLHTLVAKYYPSDLDAQQNLSKKIKAANPGIDDGTLLMVKGEHAYLPMIPDNKNPALRAVHVTDKAIVLEYSDTYKKLGVDQVVTPQVKKPVKIEVHSETKDAAMAAADKMVALGGYWGNEGKLLKMFFSLDLDPVQSCGPVGSLAGESSLISTNVQDGFGPDSMHFPWGILDRGGYGLAQWTKASRVHWLVNDAEKHGVPEGNFDFQVGHIEKELTIAYPGVLTELRSAHTIPQATRTWTYGYEGPSIPHEQQREVLGQQCLDKFNSVYVVNP